MEAMNIKCVTYIEVDAIRLTKAGFAYMQNDGGLAHVARRIRKVAAC